MDILRSLVRVERVEDNVNATGKRKRWGRVRGIELWREQRSSVPLYLPSAKTLNTMVPKHQPIGAAMRRLGKGAVVLKYANAAGAHGYQ